MEMRWNLPGKVYLVGAGPSSAKSLTRRVLEVLHRADVVFHDDAVAAELLELVPSRTAVYNVGKAPGVENLAQEKLDQRMIAAARSGQVVVRLKLGDPRASGDTQSELRALREAGIDFEILAENAAEAEEVIELFGTEDAGGNLRTRDDIHA